MTPFDNTRVPPAGRVLELPVSWRISPWASTIVPVSVEPGRIVKVPDPVLNTAPSPDCLPPVISPPVICTVTALVM